MTRNIRSALSQKAAALFAASLVTLGLGACSENRPFERESAGAQAKLAIPSSLTPPISVRDIDGAPAEWKLADRVAESLRSRDIPASSANRTRSAFVLKGEMRHGVERNGRSRVEVVWSLFDGSGRKVGEVTQMAAVPGAAFKVTNDGVVDAMADAAAESIAPLVPSSSLQLADGTETGERRANERAKFEERNRVTAVGRMKLDSGVSKNLLEPPKRDAKTAKPETAKPDTAKYDVAKPDITKRVAAEPPRRERSVAAEHTPPVAAAPPPAPQGDKTALSAVGRYEGSSLSRNLFRTDVDTSKPLPPPQRNTATRESPHETIAKDTGDTEESLGGPEPASEIKRDAPATQPPRASRLESTRRNQHAEADIPTDADRPTQLAEADKRPPRTAAVAPGSYAYWVQIGANNDEAATRAQWQRIRAAGGFDNVGNRIQRADLGARGVFYRIQLGPFASNGEAAQFCAQLRGRSIDCFLAAPEPIATRPPDDTARTAPPAKPPLAKPTETKTATPAETKPKAVEKKNTVAAPPKAAPEKPKDTVSVPPAPAPKKAQDTTEAPPMPENKPPPRSSAEKPDAPISTAPGLPGVLD